MDGWMDDIIYGDDDDCVQDMCVNDDFIDLFENKVQVQFPGLKVLRNGNQNAFGPNVQLGSAVKLHDDCAERHSTRFTDVFHSANSEHRAKHTGSVL